jgi:hypothetical protein
MKAASRDHAVAAADVVAADGDAGWVTAVSAVLDALPSS